MAGVLGPLRLSRDSKRVLDVHRDSPGRDWERIVVVEDVTVALSLARGRIAFGTAALVAPRSAARIMGAGRRPTGTTPLLARMLGGRDVALGLGTVIAVDRGKPVRGWLEGSALADAVDCLACLIVRKELPPNVVRATVGLGGASAIAGILLSRRLDPPPPAVPGQPEAVATGHPDEP